MHPRKVGWLLPIGQFSLFYQSVVCPFFQLLDFYFWNANQFCEFFLQVASLYIRVVMSSRKLSYQKMNRLFSLRKKLSKTLSLPNAIHPQLRKTNLQLSKTNRPVSKLLPQLRRLLRRPLLVALCQPMIAVESYRSGKSR